MILVQVMFWAILGHFVGDYLLQSKEKIIEAWRQSAMAQLRITKEDRLDE